MKTHSGRKLFLFTERQYQLRSRSGNYSVYSKRATSCSYLEWIENGDENPKIIWQIVWFLIKYELYELIIALDELLWFFFSGIFYDWFESKLKDQFYKSDPGM